MSAEKEDPGTPVISQTAIDNVIATLNRKVWSRDQLISSLQEQLKTATAKTTEALTAYANTVTANELLHLERKHALEDVARIDFLEASTKGYGLGWIFRESVTGRGMRLHETSLPEASPTVREAIDAAMKGG